MTEPPSERPQPGHWTPPPAPQGQYPQPPQQPPWTPPTMPAAPQGQYPQPPYPGPGPTPGPAEVWTPQPAPAPKRRAPLIASLVAVVALAAGGAITYVALSDSSDGGGSSPKAAVQEVVKDLQNSDFVGLLDDLAPGERDALANPVREDVDKLKDLHVLTPNADPSKISGVTFRATGLTYGADPIVINDHVQIVQLTGGTIDLTGDASKLPLTNQIRSLQHGSPASSTTHYNLAEHPIRIATEKVGGRWYPSLFYTAADAAAGHRVPDASQAIPAIGSASAQDAVRDEVDALLAGDVRTALAHLSPAELGAVHDYGGMLLAQAPSWKNTGIQVKTLQLTTSPLSGGATQVGLKNLVLSKDGEDIGIAIDGSCATVSAAGQTQKYCASQVAEQLGRVIGALTCFSTGLGNSSGDNCGASPATPAQLTALTDLFSGFTRLGVATTEVGGKWYVNPVRTVVDVFGTLLGGMKGNDLLELAGLGK